MLQLEASIEVEQENDVADAVQSMQGALATIKASSQKQGSQFETDARATALALAAKVLEKV